MIDIATIITALSAHNWLLLTILLSGLLLQIAHLPAIDGM